MTRGLPLRDKSTMCFDNTVNQTLFQNPQDRAEVPVRACFALPPLDSAGFIEHRGRVGMNLCSDIHCKEFFWKSKVSRSSVDTIMTVGVSHGSLGHSVVRPSWRDISMPFSITSHLGSGGFGRSPLAESRVAHGHGGGLVHFQTPKLKAF